MSRVRPARINATEVTPYSVAEWVLGASGCHKHFLWEGTASQVAGKTPVRHSKRSLRSEVRFCIAHPLCDESLFLVFRRGEIPRSLGMTNRVSFSSCTTPSPPP